MLRMELGLSDGGGSSEGAMSSALCGSLGGHVIPALDNLSNATKSFLLLIIATVIEGTAIVRSWACDHVMILTCCSKSSRSCCWC